MLTTKLRIVLLLILVNILSISVNDAMAQQLKEIEAGRVSLPNGWKLSPVGKMLPLGDLPLNIAVSPNKKMVAVTNNGQSDQTIQLIDVVKYQVVDSVVIKKGWLGLAFSKDGKYLFASGGNDNWIMRYKIQDSKIVPFDTLVFGKRWPELISIAGIAVDDKQQYGADQNIRDGYTK